MQQHRTDDGTEIVVEFSQPDRPRPYLAGQFLWTITISETHQTAVLQEEINTPTALARVENPLDGDGPSLPRWLLFAGVHQRLMRYVEGNLRRLLANRC